MPDRVLRVILTGSAEGAVRAMAETDAAAAEAGRNIGSHFDKATSRVGGAFNKLGNSLSNWGVPFAGSISKIGTNLDAAKSKGAKFSSVISDIGKVSLGALGLGFAGVAAESLHLAANFQTLTTNLVTGAGESRKNLAMVQRGIENMAYATGTSTTNLAKGMYLIESAGYHGAAGLNVLKASAEGAVAGNANLATVGDAVTTVLHDYHLPASKAVAVTNQLVAAESAGKTHMQDLAGALHSVTPIASRLGISFAEVAAATATMTSSGMSADQATQNLGHTLRSLASPNAVASNEMQQLGVNVVKMETHLGSRGLSGTIDMLAHAVAKHMGPAGTVMYNAFNQSRSAALDAHTMLSKLPPTVRTLGSELVKGTISYKDYRKESQALSPVQYNLAKQFETTELKSKGFNAMLTAGNPAARTFAGAMGKVMGGADGFNVALMLGNKNAPQFHRNIHLIGVAAHDTGGQVKGFGDYQHTLAFQMHQVEAGAGALGVKFGMFLMPIVEHAIHDVTSLVHWFHENKTAGEVLAGIIGGVLSVAIGAFTINKIAGFIKGVRTAGGEMQKMFGIITRNQGLVDKATQAMQKLTGTGSTAASTGKNVATEMEQGATNASGTLTEGATTAKDSLAEGGLTAEEREAAGGATARDEMAAGGARASESEAAGGATAEGELAAGGATAAEEVGGATAGLSAAAGAAVAGLGVAAVGLAVYAAAKAPHPPAWWIDMQPGGLTAYQDALSSRVGGGYAAGAYEKRYLAYLRSSNPHDPYHPQVRRKFRAFGGPVYGGESYVVGERGPEVLHIGTGGSGHVTSHDQSSQMMGAGGHGGGRVVNVYVTAQTNATGQQIARETEWALRHA